MVTNDKPANKTEKSASKSEQKTEEKQKSKPVEDKKEPYGKSGFSIPAGVFLDKDNWKNDNFE
ncbi:hypothetical protein, partial [Aggregatibacter actinomycetemcomitans]